MPRASRAPHPNWWRVLPVCGGLVDLNAGGVAGQGAQRAAHHVQLPALSGPG